MSDLDRIDVARARAAMTEAKGGPEDTRLVDATANVPPNPKAAALLPGGDHEQSRAGVPLATRHTPPAPQRAEGSKSGDDADGPRVERYWKTTRRLKAVASSEAGHDPGAAAAAKADDAKAAKPDGAAKADDAKAVKPDDAKAAKPDGAKGGDAKTDVARASSGDGSTDEPHAEGSSVTSGRARTGTDRIARDVMTPNPDAINAKATVRVAACKMREAGVGALPVRDDAGRFVGMITDRDITVRVTAEGRNPDTTTVRDAMTRDFVSCDEQTSVSEVGRVMQRHQIRRIPIVKRDELDKAHPSEIVGIISLADLVTDLQAPAAPEPSSTTT